MKGINRKIWKLQKVVSRVISTATTERSKLDVICASVESYWEDLEDLVEATGKSFGHRKGQARQGNDVE